jgi:DNA-binding transcriptional ArsR family regulator
MPNPDLEREIVLLHGRVCYGVADPKRVLMLYALEAGPLCVTDLAAEVGLSQPAASRHLRVLRERGLVSTVRRGPSVYYALADHRLIEALNLLRAVLAGQLAAEASLAPATRRPRRLPGRPAPARPAGPASPRRPARPTHPARSPSRAPRGPSRAGRRPA